MTRVFGAPGKALLAGGYLVLDPAYSSYVTALSSRMHARIESGPTDDNSSVTVSSPQFNGSWKYSVSYNKDGCCEVKAIDGEKNPFLQATLKTVFAYVGPTSPAHFQITLFSDAGYHTQDSTKERTSANKKKRFLYHSAPITEVPKTGLGSSAGLVAVVATALLCSILDKCAQQIIDIIHNVSQIAHCEAQGKIGSGFDVAAAVYGSIIYRRFKPEVINDLLDQQVTPSYCSELREAVDAKWDFVHESCALPPGIKLVMGDVKGGSETPKLVSKVLDWRKRDPTSVEVYSALNTANLRLMAQFERLWGLVKTKSSTYQQELISGTIFMPVANAIAAIRLGLQQLTASSGADVEPAVQTKLLDECEALPGCLGGVVPGAGGFDAICLFVEESQVPALKEESKKNSAFKSVTWLDLTEESEGIVEESATDYEGL